MHLADRFEILARLDGGEHTELFHCRDLQMGRDVALKRFRVKPKRARRRAKRGDAGHEDRLRGLFLGELVLTRTVDHPGVVPVIATSSPDDADPWFAMPWYPSDLARDLWGQRVPLPETQPTPRDRTLAILTGLAMALDAVHAAGIVHRDVKPQNLLLDDQEQAVLCDFGQALSADAPVLQAIRNPGTAPFAAPEQRSGDPAAVDGRADIHAMGVLGHLLLTGRHPDAGGPAIAGGDALEKWVLAAMADDPANRPALSDLT